ncbi:MAG: filamentous hemagglutinin N-terminal domain-containing protein, partial [Mesorhizobium sp.]|uniref:MBG domain-containing protein n=1 Tax=Mesorhizobium sp. TaxID=1871066 RepID=UPI001ACB970D
MQCQTFSPKLLNRTSAPLTALLLASTALVGFTSARAQELPTGGSVASGGVTISNLSASQLNIKQSTNSAIVNWQSFSIGSGATVNIDQPTSTSTMLNRVTGGTKSTIAGQLNANGQVFLVNPNGIAISKTGKVSAAGFVGSSLDISDDDFKAGKLKFQGKGASAAVSNEGAISIGRGGYAALIGGSVDNAGTISVPLGKVGLGSGEKATLDLSGDGFLQVSVPTQAGGSNALVSNSGTISADGGTVELKAAAVRDAARQAVNMSGVIEARTVSGQSGAIVLGGDQGDVEISGKLDTSAASSGKGGKITVTGRKLKLKGATVDASGKSGGGTIKIGGDKQGSGTLQRAATTEVDAATTINASATGNGNGGTVIVWSDEVTGFQGTILARGGDSGGDGGFSEVSSHDVLDFDGNVDLSARFGDTGYLLLDPYNLTISTTGSPTVPGSGPNFSPTQTSTLRVSTLVNALNSANVVVSTGTSGSQAGDITVASAVQWSSGNSLTLSAYRNIAVNAGLTSTGGGAINLRADSSGTGTGTVSFASSAIKASTSGVVSIYYNPASNPAGSGINTTSYTSSSDYSGNIAGGATLNAAMLVNTLNDLRNINNNQDGNYALGRSIDASGTTFTSAPVGTLSGSFDGLGNTISNLTITSGDNAIGLFGTIAGGATVRNLNLANVAVTGTGNANFAGGLAGSNQGSVSGATVSGTVKITGDSYRYAGGLVGYNDGAISGAISTASVSAGYYSHAGGLAGGLTGSITGSSASGTVTVGAQGSGGGLVGEANQGSSIMSSFATGTVTGGSPSQVGGLAGLLNGGSITASYSSSVVNAGNGSSAGGLVGATRNGASINMSYATGAVTVGNGYLGGLVGATLSAGDTITNSYATGKLTGLYLGGLVGSNYGSISSSYFDIDTTGASAGVGYSQTTTGGTGLHTSDFMTASNFTGWTFGTTAGGPGWVIVDVDSSLNNAGGAAGGTRPMLLSEYSTTITNAHQLQLMALNLNGKYTLGNNIDASTTAGGQGVWGAGGFVPIGSAIATSSAIPTNANLPMGTSNERAFTGTFDGKGFSVSNLYINRPTTDFVGLIGFATAATIQNVTLNGGSVTGRDHVGALLGGDRGFDSNYNFIATYLTNLSASTAVSGRDFVGGLAGSIEAGWVTTVSASGTVSGRDYVGGLGGYISSNSGFVQNDSSVSAIAASATGAVSGRNNVGGLFGYFYSGFYGTSFATGNVTATGDNVGGLIGQGMGGVSSNSTDNLYATGSVTGNNYVGGLIGFATSFTLTRSYATGAVTGNTAVGGLVGSNDSGSLIDLSFATGVVRGVDQVGGLAGRNLSVIGVASTTGTYATGAVYGTSNVGGLVGYNGFVNMGSYSLNGRIQSSYSIGAVNGTTNVGGLVGYNGTDPSGNYAPTIKNSYWDTETAGASLAGVGGGVTTGANAGATGKTTAQLMAALQTPFSSTTWGIVANTSLPYFKWLYASTPQVVTGTAYSDRGTTPLAGVATNILVNGTITPASAVGSTGANGYYYFLLPNGTIASGGSQVLVTSSGPSAGATFQQNATGSLNGLSIYGGYLKQQGAASTLSALSAARATAIGANAAASSLIGGLANMEIDPSGSTFSIDQAISVPGTLVFSSTGTVNQTASISANGLLLLGSGGNYALNNAGNSIGTVAASTGTVSVADSSDLTIGTVAGTSGVTATGAVTLQTAGKLTIAAAAKVTAGANSNAVLAAGGAFVNNRGSDAVSVSGTGRWLVYASGPTGNTFGNLDSGNTAIWNTAAGGAVSATGNRYVFAYQPTLTFASNNTSMVYGDAMPTLTYSVSGYQAGVANAYLGDNATTAFTGAPALYTPSTLALQPLGAGTYTITIDAANVAARNGYALAFNSTGLISVAKRMVTVTANSGQGKTYGDADPSSLGYGYTSLGNGVALVGALDRASGEDVGGYAIGQGTLTNGNNSNYDITFVGGTSFNIGKRAVTVTATSGQGKTYGDADPSSLGYSYTSLGSGVALVGALDRAGGEDVGGYAIGQGTLTNGNNSNYDITFDSSTFSIGKRAVTVTATAGQGKTYGNADPSSYGYSYTSLGSGVALVGVLDRASGEDVGSYAIGQGTLTNASNSNYDITFDSSTFAIGKRAVTVTATAGQGKTYGDADPTSYGYSYTSLGSGTALVGVLDRAAGENVGGYAIGRGTLTDAANANYDITFDSSTFSIGKRAVTVTATAGQGKTYGDADPSSYGYTTSGLGNGVALVGALDRASGEDVGGYAI